MSNNATRVHNPMKVITGKDTRWSYANVWEATSINGGTPKYSVSLIIPKSDTKTIDQPRALAALTEAKRQAGRVLFLNPIPEHNWQYLRSVQTVAAVCPMVSCGTLRELAAACRRLTLS